MFDSTEVGFSHLQFLVFHSPETHRVLSAYSLKLQVLAHRRKKIPPVANLRINLSVSTQ